MSAVFARVAINVRARRLFDYLLPADTSHKDIVGLRVLVPFGGKETVGIAMETTTASTVADDKIKTIKRVYHDMPPLPPATLELIRFCADYYHSPIGIATTCALPAFFRRTNTYHPPAGYRIPARSKNGNDKLSGNAATLYTLLQAGAKTVSELRRTVANPYNALKKLLALNLIERCHVWHSKQESTPALPPPASDGQQQVLATLQLDSNFAPHLLFGATGSGKSEIYMRAAERVLTHGRQVLILTPEIHLTPQLEDSFCRRFPRQRIAVLHSGLPDGERARRWLMARLGDANIVLGTRLAVFTPMPALGLIIVDEEHDDSFKQEEGGLLFSARNVAIWRAKNEKIPFIAGSATPSLESMHNASSDGWQLLTLPQRFNHVFPQIDIIGESDNIYHGMESAFVRDLSQALNAGKQCLIFINRRGYAPTLLCRQCSQPHRCHRCSSNMTVHRRHGVLSCHLCGHTMAIPTTCTHCGGKVIAAGSGTQRIEEALARLFPDIRALRIDRDAAGNTLASNYDDIQNGKVQLLIGTQLIAKGHNFPQLSLIGILNADAGLAASDLRAEERLFALLSQVIGRGTRNPAGCRVLVQTRYPSHPFYRELQNDDVNACWQRLLQQRQQSAMPPFSHLAVLRGKDKNLQRLEKFMHQTVEDARRQTAGSNVRIFDAVAPPVEKINNWHRRQMLIHARRRQPLHHFLRQFIPSLPASGNWSIDVDPLAV